MRWGFAVARRPRRPTQLWSTDPVVMGELIEHHNAVIRCVIARHKAYEVKTIGDSFMIAGGWPLTGKKNFQRGCSYIPTWPSC